MLSCKTLVSSPILLYFEIIVINVYNKIKMIEWEGTPCMSLPLLKPPMKIIMIILLLTFFQLSFVVM